MSNNQNIRGEYSDQSYHPSYSAKLASPSLVLSSSDGIHFRVHPLILQMASEVFSDMLNKAVDTGEPIQLQENCNTLKMLLDMIYPNAPCLILEDYDFEALWSLLIAADKYGIYKILQEFRVQLLTNSYFKKRSLEAFVIASRFEWKNELFATTLDAIDSLHKPNSWKLLARLDHTRALKLQKFAAVYKNAILEEVKRILDFFTDPEDRDEVMVLVEATDEEKLSMKLVALVNMELDSFPSGRTMKDDFWNRLPNRVVLKELLNSVMMTALRKQMQDITKYGLPGNIDDISLH